MQDVFKEYEQKYFFSIRKTFKFDLPELFYRKK